VSEALLQVENLVKHYPVGGGMFAKPVGTVKAVDGVSFTLRKGETLGLVGGSSGRPAAASSSTAWTCPRWTTRRCAPSAAASR